jgi:Domain of unknown function (DUF4351)
MALDEDTKGALVPFTRLFSSLRVGPFHRLVFRLIKQSAVSRMQKYDVALKSLLQTSGLFLLERLAGVHLARWVNTELPKIQTARLDLLGEGDTGELVHFELQSTNDSKMPLRMVEYAIGVYRQFGRFPRQFVLYVGQPALQMSAELIGSSFSFRYELVDIREIDESEFLRGPASAGNVLAILGRVKNPEETIREVLSRIAQLPPDQQPLALQQLVILSGLRRLGKYVREEVQRMPLEINLFENEIIGPALRQGMREGRLSIIRRQLRHRFGQFPEWVELRLSALSEEQLEELSDRLLDARRLEDLFEQQQ